MIIIYLVGAIVIFDVAFRFYPSKRRKLIDSILKDLESLDAGSEKYAQNECIRFFNSLKSPCSFLYWQLLVAPKLNASKLLELADFGIVKWEKVLYMELGALEKKKFPGLLTPLVKYLDSSKFETYIDVGCGHMEVFRQILAITHTRDKKIMVGVDMSNAAYDRIKANFGHLKETVDVKQITVGELSAHLKKKSKKHKIYFILGDAVEITKSMKVKFDVAFSSKVKHHIHKNQKTEFDSLIKKLGDEALEYDDLKTPISWIPPLITAWNKPVLLNGALISRLRQPTTKEISKTVLIKNPPGVYIKKL